MCTTSKIHHQTLGGKRSIKYDIQLSGEQQFEFANLANAAWERRKAKRYIDRIFYKRTEELIKYEANSKPVLPTIWSLMVNYFSHTDQIR
ncbi:hypothetical protein [Amphritea japonica]|uniref:Uncharacterized protein n=1 Tax=Amphritea japonica ATCC BAA-1530 TaxID=1278309 RepID=A0A7R6PHP1_9GAMM|nr:hypothetical protein [Amphritea japonica]BBB24665.1 hypothetical protein AMJAP_0066 [Amphritea japonica ATCC BAA-1530]